MTSPIHNETRPLQQIGTFIKSRKGRTILALTAASIVLVAAGAAAYTRYFKTEPSQPAAQQTETPVIQAETPKTVPSTLDGTQVPNEEATRRPLAVMVENHPEARPQSGLTSASVVWEVIVEGGITRFMAVYGPRSADKIGPVRSARTQYISWAAGYKALYAHAGGSQGGLALIERTNDIVDLAHTGAYFHREPRAGLASEHTLYTSTKDLYDYAKEKGASLTSDFKSLTYGTELELEKRPASASITVDFSSESYKVDWLYERADNIYKRTLAGAPHKDATSGDQIAAKNIVILVVDRSYDPNTNGGKGEYTFTTEGSGKALVFKNGEFTEGTWHKERKNTMLTVEGSDGKEIALAPGATWYEVIPPDRLANVTHTETAQ